MVASDNALGGGNNLSSFKTLRTFQKNFSRRLFISSLKYQAMKMNFNKFLETLCDLIVRSFTKEGLLIFYKKYLVTANGIESTTT